MQFNNELSEYFPKGRVAYFVTSNIHKFQEAKQVLSKYNIATAKLNISTIEIQDDNLEKIAKFTVERVMKSYGLPIFVGDSGLFIEVLNGFPGPYSSYIFQTIGTKGILKLMENKENRNAYFQSIIAYSSPKENPICFSGKVKGTISLQEMGNFGFGFDPIFSPSKGRGKTFAEMNTEQKNLYSHRAKALKKFAKWYSSNLKRIF
jgi:XTP/dITP diphosphohydrolase